MTSSLVGSEMCIRDRTWPLTREGHLLWCQFPPAPAEATQRGVPLALDPVSYTHLTLPTICSV
eukprot:6113184-Prorocentrum_lima.AAC.1